MEVETDLFINEVEKRPAIWDMTSSEYSLIYNPQTSSIYHIHSRCISETY